MHAPTEEPTSWCSDMENTSTQNWEKFRKFQTLPTLPSIVGPKRLCTFSGALRGNVSEPAGSKGGVLTLGSDIRSESAFRRSGGTEFLRRRIWWTGLELRCEGEWAGSEGRGCGWPCICYNVF